VGYIHSSMQCCPSTHSITWVVLTPTSNAVLPLTVWRGLFWLIHAILCCHSQYCVGCIDSSMQCCPSSHSIAWVVLTHPCNAVLPLTVLSGLYWLIFFPIKFEMQLTLSRRRFNLKTSREINFAIKKLVILFKIKKNQLFHSNAEDL
jgi:hypothetical protein